MMRRDLAWFFLEKTRPFSSFFPRPSSFLQDTFH